MGRQGQAAAPRKTVGGGIRTIPCHPLQCLPQSKPLISSPTHHSLIPKATGPGHDSTPWQLHLHSRRNACALQSIYNKQARNECPTLSLSGRWTAQLGKEKASLHARLPSLLASFFQTTEVFFLVSPPVSRTLAPGVRVRVRVSFYSDSDSEGATPEGCSWKLGAQAVFESVRHHVIQLLGLGNEPAHFSFSSGWGISVRNGMGFSSGK